jgi:hypothetical protein
MTPTTDLKLSQGMTVIGVLDTDQRFNDVMRISGNDRK